MIAALHELLSRAVLEHTDDGALRLRMPLADLASVVPESLREMIDMQVDRLSVEDQRLLEAASVVGPELSSAAVAAALVAPLAEVEAALDHFARRRHLVEACGRAEWPDGTVSGSYRFVHQLHQSVLYGRTAPATRRELHRRIAERMATAFGSDGGTAVSELAVHFEQGGDADRSVRYAAYAAKQAIRRHAHREAIVLLSRALARLRALPSTPERTKRTLSLEMHLGQAFMAVEGYAAPEVEGAYARARELCCRIGETPELYGALLGLWGYYVVRGALGTAEGLAADAMRLAVQSTFPPMLLGAHHAVGVTKLYQGDFAAARRHLDEAAGLYDPALRESYGMDSVQDPKASSLVYSAFARWFLGDAEGAIVEADRATAFARTLDHPFSLLFALDMATTIAQCVGNPERAREGAEEVVSLASKHGFPLWLATGTVSRGWSRAKDGESEAGIEEMQRGLADLCGDGVVLAGTFLLGMLAGCMAEAGRFDEALSRVDEGLALAHQEGERFYEAELHRLRGELLLARSPRKPDAARACFTEAHAIARRQQAKSLELRVDASLSRLAVPDRRKARP